MLIHWMEFKLLDKSTNHPSRTQMIRELTRLGHHVRYFCGYRRFRPEFGLAPDQIRYLGRPGLSRLTPLVLLSALVLKILRSLAGKSPDVLMIDYSLNLAAFPLLLLSRAFRGRPRIILDVRTIPVDRKRFRFQHAVFVLSLRLAVLSCDGLSFITPFMRNIYRDRIGFDPRRSTFWTSGVDPILFDPDRQAAVKREREFVLFYHGGISLSRGLGSLIEAVGILRDRGLPVRLELIGNVVERAAITSLVETAGGEAVCRLRRPVSHDRIPGLIKACDLPVIPLPDFFGWRVSSPIKLMEYMAMAKCMVLTPIEAHRNVTGDAPWAFYALGSNPAQLAEAVERAYRRRADLDEMGRNARRLALSSYTWRAQAEKISGFMESL